ncbi:Protein kinase-like (PK-like) [Glarea lozoyensis ATCC 20868]|uniref:Protein kinase-like (PK-like) n=2 Tax=Glarea lozoyensis TaxID=101852 RepID=S3CHZ9_GLAL2|nr:Protein kinase-like (PK-like) [Glarea lozoyensis ATCC 20868]EHL01462.1 putative Cyclin-dependent kinase 2 [Glarea lozoyensis 74030]EPE24889.1 Protein kinase-like (PK-like) [Glarea lozoyensis ATCC 20868]
MQSLKTPLETDIKECLLIDIRKLRRLLRYEMKEWPQQSNRFFLPADILNSLQLAVGQYGLRIVCPDMPDSQYSQFLSVISTKAIKLLCLLLIASPAPSPSAIHAFIENDITDDDLPFQRLSHDSPLDGWKDRSTTEFVLCKQSHIGCLRPNHIDCGIVATRDWDQEVIISLARNQWTFLAPIFSKNRGKIPHYDFTDNIVLPFTEDDQVTSKQGGYGKVWSVRIHPAHHNLITSSNPKGARLAVKQLFSADESAFHSECDFLGEITVKEHPNTVPLLATYKLKGSYHLLFPWAPANLGEYWHSISMPNWNKETCHWFLKQVHGLVSALKTIHVFPHERNPLSQDMEVDYGRLTTAAASRLMQPNMDTSLNKYGRHGDLKPENVLYLEDGTLQLADFGLGKFHRLESRSRLDPDSIACSPTYSPPELAVGELVSRAYDIWSLGCIFLEFVTWLSGGSEALERFAVARQEKALDRVVDDLFYTVKKASGAANGRFAVIRAGVFRQIQFLRSSKRQSAMISDVLNIIEHNMLVVKANERIKAETLLSKMERILQRGHADSVYLLGNDQKLIRRYAKAGIKRQPTSTNGIGG